MASDQPEPNRTIQITVEPNRGVFVAIATYAVGKATRERREIATTRVRALHRVISRMRRNGHGGRPYSATVDGQIMAGTIPHPNA
jgi:hypothetical protein